MSAIYYQIRKKIDPYQNEATIERVTVISHSDGYVVMEGKETRRVRTAEFELYPSFSQAKEAMLSRLNNKINKARSMMDEYTRLYISLVKLNEDPENLE